MTQPTIAGTAPIEVKLEKEKKYFFCTCGKSQKQPFCDGSHSGTDFSPHMFKAEKDGSAWLCMCKHTGNQPFCDGTHSKVSD
jgi:CDGSH-type Zn-finger protein